MYSYLVKNRQFYLLLFVSMLAMSMLNACGFKLRGSLELSQNISPIYLQQNSLFELGRQVKQLLTTNDIKVADKERNANTSLSLINEQKSRRVLSVDTDGRAREYLLTYTVKFAIKIKKPEGLEAKAIEDSLSLSRSLLFETDAVLAVANESEVLYKDMQRDVARLILLKLQAHSRSSSVKAEPVKENAGNIGETSQ